MWERIVDFFKGNVSWAIPTLRFTDFIEVIIIAIILYYVMLWIKKTRAWMLLKGIVVILAFTLLSSIFNLTTISYLISKISNIAIIAVLIIFQPELRRALEQLGTKNAIISMFILEDAKGKEERLSLYTADEIVKACMELSKTHTGALIVLEQISPLDEYLKTGIVMDALVTKQLLIQVFEDKTPLHDGAVIIRNNRIAAATCYLPVSSNMEISKSLGTRHRAAVGISEVSDSLTVIVSEETGTISLAVGGELFSNMDEDSLRNKLRFLEKKPLDVNRFKLWRGKHKNEGKSKGKAAE